MVKRALDAIRSAMARGELLQAYDLAERALIDSPGSAQLRYAAVLALARAGATRHARTEFRVLLGDIVDESGASALQNEVASLDARITKDEGLAARGASRHRLLADAADHY